MSYPTGAVARDASRSTFAADAAVLAVAVVWGASYPVAKSALAYVIGPHGVVRAQS